MNLYPLKFNPIFKERIWGGNKLQTLLHKDVSGETIGESWEISDVKGEPSVVAEGALKGKTLQELSEIFQSELLGKKVYDAFGTKFPLLIKYIDAKRDLSIQVHPNDTLAKERHNSFGKTEMWYVMQADEGAKLMVGFNQKVSKEDYQVHLKNNTLTEILNFQKVKKGDVYFLPTGRVHAIGGGIVLAEIQQTSDITYRIFDWNRVDAAGNSRELHTDLALDAIDYTFNKNYKTDYLAVENTTSTLVDCPYFTTNLIPFTGELTLNHDEKDSFVIYLCVKGNVAFKTQGYKETLSFGETILLPATIKNIKISADEASELLEVYIK
ncbi:class I mannose-6-phosphate isomerase [Kordia sp. YSTF-M3]|uniref:Phosphohexomutase n=1 Tax=Kordia aestuariivivens TaxID=2759037 RepID=A0ABR7QGP6_9FLAO|nr:type I phosphomannose isomerase catalytic subunit [Kordia aestuariivivens]MBC8757536.1 class I mannose-6-phosphate isomerase [Kordia aestuariivivens]